MKRSAPIAPLPPASSHRDEGPFVRLKSALARVIPAAILISFCLALPLRADDFWEKKPYGEWTESEALRVLQDSAWSKLGIVWTNGEARTDEPETRSTAGGEARTEEHSNCCRTFTRAVDGASPEISRDGSASSGRTALVRRILYYRVLLFSSTRVRQALVRLAQIRGGIQQVQEDASLEKPLEDLVIAVTGPDMQPFESVAAEALAGPTYLRAKKGGLIEPKDFVPSGMRQDGLALFVFPRIVDGKPAFSLADDQIEFGTGEGAFKIRATFKLKKMVVNGIPDF